MWKQVPISDDKRYVLNLCQSADRRRFCVVTEIGVQAPDMVLQTEEVSPATLRSYAFQEIEGRTRTTDGQVFVFGAHGEWFTEIEAERLRDTNHDSIPWVTSIPPRLPPK